MKTAEGEDEMVCQTGSAFFDTPEGKIKRGVISFYAAKTLPEAITVESWLRSMREVMTTDVRSGRLRFGRPLQILGDSKTQLPKVIKSAKD
jgi:hypothetical protein